MYIVFSHFYIIAWKLIAPNTVLKNPILLYVSLYQSCLFLFYFIRFCLLFGTCLPLYRSLETSVFVFGRKFRLMCFLKRQAYCCLCWNVNWGLSEERGLSGVNTLQLGCLCGVEASRRFPGDGNLKYVVSRVKQLNCETTKNVVYIFDNRAIASRVATQSRD